MKACDGDQRRNNLGFAAMVVVKGKQTPRGLRFAARCNHTDMRRIIWCPDGSGDEAPDMTSSCVSMRPLFVGLRKF